MMRSIEVVLVAALLLGLSPAPARAEAPGEFDEASLLILRGDYEGAIRAYEAFLAAAPDDRLAPVASMAIANVRLAVLRDTTGGEAALDRIVGEHRSSRWAADAARRRAECVRSRGAWAEAGEEYELALQIASAARARQTDDWTNETAAAAADCWERAGDRTRTIETYSRLLDGSPPPAVAAAALYRLGESYEAEGRAASAAESYGRVLESYPSAGEFDRALAKRALIEKHRPVDWAPYLDYSEATRLIAERDFPAALAKCDAVLASSAGPALRECAEYRKITLETVLSADFGAGCERLRAFLADHPNGLRAETARETLEREWTPVAEVERLVRENPDDADLLARLGGAYLRVRAPARAQGPLSRAVALRPDDADVRLQLGYARLGAGDTEGAIADIEHYLEKNPNSPAALNQIGYLFLGRGDAETAIGYFHRYIDAAPDDPNAHDSMGEGLLGAGRAREAAAEYEKAIAIDPSFSNSYFMLGRI
ncbi:MAG: hypothetical protein EHM19_11965, partial [Candidatus Latescibacterota bacterium]